MDEPTLVVLNEIESDNTNEISIRSNASLKVKNNTTKESDVIEEVPDETYMESHMDKNGMYNWKSVAKEGNELFEYLIQNYYNMLDGEDKIKHFDVGFGWYWLIGDAFKIKMKDSDEIQHELIPWIKREFNEGELFKKKNWKPFRNQDTIIYMFLGYKRLFQFKHYYFQLTLSSDCENDTINCKYCQKEDYGNHFGVALYGWKDINYDKLQPVNVLHILEDNMIPESHWAKKI
jgi:hypothetical protein